MAKKIVRLYFSTFVDVEMESDDFSNEHEMKEYVRLNASEYIDENQIQENLALNESEIDVYDNE